MTYYLGIDIGTTYTAAAVWRDGRCDIASLGNRAPTIPSVVLLRDDQAVLTGEAAVRRAATEPGRVAREFKRRIGDPTPIIVAGTPYSADALVAKLLRSVVDQVSQVEGGRPDGIAVSHPANWGSYKLDLLRQAISLADLDDVATVTEPEAAAIHYASLERVEPGSVIAVYDLGGGTFDAAVLRKTGAGWEILGQPEGIERLGGVDFDAAVYHHVSRAVGGVIDDLDPDDPTAQAAVARLRQECVEAKEALSSDSDVSIPVLLPNLQTEVRLTRSEYEQMVRPALADTITAMNRALRSAEVKPDDVTAVLLVGGSSRTPLVAEMVSSVLGRPVAVDAHPKYGVALGAAITAAHRALGDAATGAAGGTTGGAGSGVGAAAAGAAVGAALGAGLGSDETGPDPFPGGDDVRPGSLVAPAAAVTSPAPGGPSPEPGRAPSPVGPATSGPTTPPAAPDAAGPATPGATVAAAGAIAAAAPPSGPAPTETPWATGPPPGGPAAPDAPGPPPAWSPPAGPSADTRQPSTGAYGSVPYGAATREQPTSGDAIPPPGRGADLGGGNGDDGDDGGGDHGAAPRRSAPLLIGGVAAALLVGLGAYLGLRGGDDGGEQTDTDSDTGSQTTDAPSTEAPDTTPTTPAPTTTTVPPGPYVQINDVQLEGDVYRVNYQVSGYTPRLDGAPDSLHIHFFLNTTLPENAGNNGNPVGDWNLTDAPQSFVTEYGPGNKGDATQMCSAVATVNHEVHNQGTLTGNCVDLPA